MRFYLILINLILLPFLIAQECNVDVFSDTKVVVKTSAERTSITRPENVINLNKCPISIPKIPEEAIELYIVNQNIPNLPAFAVSNLTNVSLISLENNKIKHLEKYAFWNLTSLKKINLKFNDLETLEYGPFNTIQSLDTLLLASNLLKNIQPDTFKGLVNLSNLDLSYNELTTWNNEWSKYAESIWSINLQGNKLKTLPERAFGKPKRIVNINLSNNEIVTLDPNTFIGISNLNELLLDNNKIEYFHPDTFAPFNGTLILDKTERRRIITQMDRHMHATFSGIDSLYINNNRLTYLPSKVLNDLHKTNQINIHSNPWNCICYRNIIKWAQDSKNKKSVDIFKRTCLRRSNPVCVLAKSSPNTCTEEVDPEAITFYFDNYKDINFAQYNTDDLEC